MLSCVAATTMMAFQELAVAFNNQTIEEYVCKCILEMILKGSLGYKQLHPLQSTMVKVIRGRPWISLDGTHDT